MALALPPAPPCARAVALRTPPLASSRGGRSGPWAGCADGPRAPPCTPLRQRRRATHAAASVIAGGSLGPVARLRRWPSRSPLHPPCASAVALRTPPLALLRRGPRRRGAEVRAEVRHQGGGGLHPVH